MPYIHVNCIHFRPPNHCTHPDNRLLFGWLSGACNDGELYSPCLLRVAKSVKPDNPPKPQGSR